MNAFLDNFKKFSPTAWIDHGLTLRDEPEPVRENSLRYGAQKRSGSQVLVMAAALGVMTQIFAPIAAATSLKVTDHELAAFKSSDSSLDRPVVDLDLIKPGQWAKVISLMERTRVKDDNDDPAFPPMF